MSLIDTIICSGEEKQVQLLRPPCSLMGERSQVTAKKECKDSSCFLPVYGCSVFRLCSPFGATTDPDLIPTCEGCERYHRPRPDSC